MNVRQFALSAIVATLSVALNAQAQDPQPQGKTRAQVSQEMRLAQHDGTMQVGHTLPVPPGKANNNKVKHALAKHPGEKAPSFDSHDAAKAP